MNRATISTLALTMVLAGACASNSRAASPPSPTLPPSPTSVAASVRRPAIEIVNQGSGFAFSATPVPAGATVTVHNGTDAQHTVTADTAAGGFDLVVDAGATTTFHAPSQRGMYRFHCNIHTSMTGTLVVT